MRQKGTELLVSYSSPYILLLLPLLLSSFPFHFFYPSCLSFTPSLFPISFSQNRLSRFLSFSFLSLPVFFFPISLFLSFSSFLSPLTLSQSPFSILLSNFQPFPLSHSLFSILPFFLLPLSFLPFHPLSIVFPSFYPSLISFTPFLFPSYPFLISAKRDSATANHKRVKKNIKKSKPATRCSFKSDQRRRLKKKR